MAPLGEPQNLAGLMNEVRGSIVNAFLLILFIDYVGRSLL